MLVVPDPWCVVQDPRGNGGACPSWHCVRGFVWVFVVPDPWYVSMASCHRLGIVVQVDRVPRGARHCGSGIPLARGYLVQGDRVPSLGIVALVG